MELQRTSPAKNPGVAAVLSFFFSGLGQIYNGQILKGIFVHGCAGSKLCALVCGNWSFHGLHCVGLGDC